ncbi:hypothetical protein BH09SUM1_BH09SUM1_00260 [soil metagenome]
MKNHLRSTVLLISLLVTFAGARESAAPPAMAGMNMAPANPEHTINAVVSPSGGLVAGEPATFSITLRSKTGAPITHDDLVIAHTQKIHLLIIDPSLTDYHHEHPNPTADPGVYTFTMTPWKSGEYKIFADLLPNATAMQEYAATTFSVAGEPDPVKKSVNRTAEADGYKFDMRFDDEKMPAGVANMAHVTVTGPDGKPFTALEPVMGAFAHTVGFNETRTEIAHVHPMGKEPESAEARGGPELEFHTNFAATGYKKLFVQVQIDGKQVFAPFGIEVTAAPAVAQPAFEISSGHSTGPSGVLIPDSADKIFAAVDARVAVLDQSIRLRVLSAMHKPALETRDLLGALPERLTSAAAGDTELAMRLRAVQKKAAVVDSYGDAANRELAEKAVADLKSEVDAIKVLINAGGYQVAAAKEVNNALCPVSGKAVGSMMKGAHIDYAGQRVGLCCMGCVGAFNKDSDAKLKAAIASAPAPK